MDDRERYLFDLNGYLAIPGALSAGVVAAIDALMDERVARDVAPDETTHRFADVLDWGPAVRALIDHEPVVRTSRRSSAQASGSTTTTRT